MRRKLARHPLGAPANIAVAAEVERAGEARLRLSFLVTGDVGSLKVPPAATPERADDLWKHTCFEAFVRPAADAGYWEFNFAPSRQWAAYRFSDYRTGMAEAEVPAPKIDVCRDERRLRLDVELDLAPEFGLLGELDWRLGLSAVIETEAGEASHWALAHPAGAPDFHHRDCFALELPPPGRE